MNKKSVLHRGTLPQDFLRFDRSTRTGQLGPTRMSFSELSGDLFRPYRVGGLCLCSAHEDQEQPKDYQLAPIRHGHELMRFQNKVKAVLLSLAIRLVPDIQG